ncbi:MAG: hypothetical protein AAF689_12230 [Pseudomonadota bacterium]
MKGIPEFEREIVTSVWGYGSQLGALTDAVLELATAMKVDETNLEAVQKLREKHQDTEVAKRRAATALRARIAELEARLETLTETE